MFSQENLPAGPVKEGVPAAVVEEHGAPSTLQVLKASKVQTTSPPEKEKESQEVLLESLVQEDELPSFKGTAAARLAAAGAAYEGEVTQAQRERAQKEAAAQRKAEAQEAAAQAKAEKPVKPAEQEASDIRNGVVRRAGEHDKRAGWGSIRAIEKQWLARQIRKADKKPPESSLGTQKPTWVATDV